MDTLAFLNRLHRGGNYRYLWFDTKRTVWFNGVKQLPVPPDKVNVYFGVHPTRAEHDAYHRAKLEDIAAINCLFAEFDIKDYGDKPKTLKHVERLRPVPSVIVDSGGGYHAYWILARIFLLETTFDLERARIAQANWVHYAGGDKGAKDITRVLRLPGTHNYKEKYAPNFPEVQFVKFNLELEYELAGLARLSKRAAEIPPEVVGKPEQASTALSKYVDRVSQASVGERNRQLNIAAFYLGKLVAQSQLDRVSVESELERAALRAGLKENEVRATIRCGLNAGMRR